MTDKWRKMSEMYKRFAKSWENICDFSESSAKEMFDYESRGKGNLKIGVFNKSGQKFNGFAVGKHWMDVTIAMWKEEMKRGLLFKQELLNDGFPNWFLCKVGIL